MRRRGFTLIELLIVMAILILLAGILFTVFAGAREKSRQTHCMNNLKQLGAAILLYKQDYDGGWPPEARALFPQYVADKQVFVCPDDCTSAGTRKEIASRSRVYSSYLRGMGDALPRLSGEERRRAYRSNNCEYILISEVVAQFKERLPVLTCNWHLLPGLDVANPSFRDKLSEAGIYAPILLLRQDGSVDTIMVPAECPYELATTMVGTAHIDDQEYRDVLKSVRRSLVERGICEE